ncbi:hypothetical protein PsYK624_078180 [Phanerochaete sordida]|uniref:Telomere-associated protein Rif1 N-terminal domain-containing protein n=1 Tax=Phanerochaete sordida TaxID=48140 RepID=A0A9P3G954_9APHY|nr:hypothetical protein PsYK624_078180 [Phanerochaete sordida]
MARPSHEDADPTRPQPSPDQANYFHAPIDTLVRSLKGTTRSSDAAYDLTHAYTLFVARIKAFATFVDATADARPVALAYLQSHADAVLACVIRDTDLEALPPATAKPRGTLDGVQPAYMRASRDEDVAVADAVRQSAVCNQALCLASCLLSIPLFCTVLPAHGLGAVLDRLLDIATAERVQRYNAEKTRALAVWILSIQNLPADVLEARRERFAATIGAVIGGKGSSEQMRVDGLKTIHSMLCGHPSLFLHDSTSIFPSILSSLTSQSLTIRNFAALALAGFTQAVVWSHTTSTPARQTDRWVYARDHLRRCIHDFAEEQCEPSTGRHKTLHDLIAAALPTTDSNIPADAPWAFAVMGSLTVLADSAFFRTPPLLTMILHALNGVRLHPSAAVAALHAAVWRCLVWAFARLADGGELPAARSPAVPVDHFRDRVFATVRQDGWRGARSALAAVLLEEARRDPGGGGVAEAVVVVEELLRRSSPLLFAEGVALLLQLTGGGGKPQDAASFDPQDVLSLPLLDGSLLDVDLQQVAERIEPFKPTSVRPLSDDEIDAHWDGLFGAWRKSAGRTLADNTLSNQEGDVLQVWKSLLMARTSRQPDAARNAVTSIITDLVEQSTLGCVAFAQRVWDIVEATLQAEQLTQISGGLADTLVKRLPGAASPNHETESAERSLCAAVLACCTPEYWEKLDAQLNDDEIFLELWRDTADRWTKSRSAHAWKDLSSFLKHPILRRATDKTTLACWTELLQSAISGANSKGDAIIEDIVLRLSSHRLIPPAYIPIFISQLSFNDDHVHAPTTLRSASKFLSKYPPQNIYPALEVIRALTHLISRCRPSHIPIILETLSDTFCTWLCATDTVVPRADYEDIITDLYCTILRRLKDVASSPNEVLRDYENLLYLPLADLRSRRTGQALQEFCEAVWREQRGFVDFPEKLLRHLVAWYDCEVDPALHPAFVPEASQRESQSQAWPETQASEDDLALDGHTETREVLLPAAVIRSIEPPEGQRRPSTDSHSPVLNDSSRINGVGNTCSDALELRSPRENSFVHDHDEVVHPSRHSPENIDPIGSSVAPRKRTLSSDEDDWTQPKRRRFMDPALTQESDDSADVSGDGVVAVQHGDGTGHSQDSRHCESQASQSNVQKSSNAIRWPSPEIPFAGQSGLPSPPRTAEAEHWNRECPSAPASQESGGPVDPDAPGNEHAAAIPLMSQPLRALHQALEAITSTPDMSIDDALAAQQAVFAMQAALANRLKQKLRGRDS